MKGFKLEANELLQRNQLKTILGGQMGDDGGTCAYMTGRSGDGDPIGQTNVSRETAESMTANGGSWCCDSCSTASWAEVQNGYIMLK